jgi:hypothetical protein
MSRRRCAGTLFNRSKAPRRPAGREPLPSRRDGEVLRWRAAGVGLLRGAVDLDVGHGSVQAQSFGLFVVQREVAS